jgi:hypothetical protein
MDPTLLVVTPPKTAKRPSLITHPLQPYRVVDMTDSFVQENSASCAPCFGGPHTSADDSSPMPPAQTTRPPGSRAAIEYAHERRRWGLWRARAGGKIHQLYSGQRVI